MSTSLGIAVGDGSVRAVVLRGGRIAAANETALESGDTLADAVAELLAGAPLPRYPRPRVVLAVGPSLAQTKRLSGLPPLDDARLLAQVVREGAGRFFLRNGAPLAVTGVRMVEPGTAWAAALDERTVRAVEAGCRAAGLRVDAAVPSVAVLGTALPVEQVLWPDGDVVAEVRMEDRELAAVRRLPRGAAPAAAPIPVIPALARLGDEAWRYADAYGAASLPAWEPMVVRPGGGGAGTVPRWRMALAGAALAASLVAMLTAPALRAMGAEDRAAARIAAVQDRRRAAADTERELARVSAALAEGARFGADRYAATLLLADVTAALPAGTALVAFRADSTSGSIVALAPRAALVMRPLAKVPGIVAPEIVGPVTREATAGQELERVSIRFGLDAKRRAGTALPEGSR
ncbi:MAG TPA: hypothetical protein VFQ45_09850 [Longimicrobium sp.]|nr:hypothetical protein [Longimicrobium sp.]